MAEYDDHQYEKIAFDLGWDYAMYGLRILDEVPQSFLDGYNAAKQKGTVKPIDKYISKWLYLRQNALRRKRSVAQHVTPRLLEFIDIGICPISRQKLTYGTGTDTDWSIDRINNEGAYAAGNICVLSTRVNSIKSNLNVYEIDQIVHTMERDHILHFDTLSLLEWKRLAWLTQKSSGHDDMLLNIMPPPLLKISDTDKFIFFFVMNYLSSFSKIKTSLKTSLGINYYKYRNLSTLVSDSVYRNLKGDSLKVKFEIFQRLFDAFADPEVVEYVQMLKEIPYFITRSNRVVSSVFLKMPSYKVLQHSWLEKDFDEIEHTWNIESGGYLDGFNYDEQNVQRRLDGIFNFTDKSIEQIRAKRSK